MSSFYDVVSGNPTLAADLNQLVDALNGTVASQITLLGSSGNGYRTQNNVLPSLPASDSTITAMYVSGDGQVRYGVYLRHSDGYGGVLGGNGTSITAHLYAQSGGWKIDEGLTVAGALTVVGSSSFAGIAASGTSSLDGGNIVTDGAGNITTVKGITGHGNWSTSGTFSASGQITGGSIVSSGYVYAESGQATFGWDGSYTFVDGTLSFNVRKNGVHAMRADTVANWNVSGGFYGFITAMNSLFGAGTGNADIAEHLLTVPGTEAGMAVCIVDNDTVAPCQHVACRRAKLISSQPTILMKARVRNDDNLTPIEGHESAMPVVVGGAVPVQIVPGSTIKLGDLLTTAGPKYPGKLRPAQDNEYAIADVVNITPEGLVWAWVR